MSKILTVAFATLIMASFIVPVILYVDSYTQLQEARSVKWE